MSSDIFPEGCATCAYFDLDEVKCTSADGERDWELWFLTGGYCQSWQPRENDGRHGNGD